jgi:hypothetical protein
MLISMQISPVGARMDCGASLASTQLASTQLAGTKQKARHASRAQFGHTVEKS